MPSLTKNHLKNPQIQDSKQVLRDIENGLYNESEFFKSISDTQLYNIAVEGLDMVFANQGICSDKYLNSFCDYPRIINLYYNVSFPPKATRNVCLDYSSVLTFYRSETKAYVNRFEYLLNPAKTWSGFKDLAITVIPPERAPYIINSSVEFDEREDGTYTAFLETLPENDLIIDFYSQRTIDANKTANGSIVFASISTVIISACLVVYFSRKKKRVD